MSVGDDKNNLVNVEVTAIERGKPIVEPVEPCKRCKELEELVKHWEELAGAKQKDYIKFLELAAEKDAEVTAYIIEIQKMKKEKT